MPISVIFRSVSLLMLLLSAVATAAETRDPYSYFFNETFGDFSEELVNAKDGGKKGVMIFFEMDECPFCHYMKKNVLNRPDVQEYFRANFLLFPVDIEGDIEVTDFTGKVTTQKELAFEQFRVRATPVIAFFDLDGKLIHRYTGRTSDADEFLLMGRYVAEGHYKDTPFSRFKRQQRRR